MVHYLEHGQFSHALAEAGLAEAGIQSRGVLTHTDQPLTKEDAQARLKAYAKIHRVSCVIELETIELIEDTHPSWQARVEAEGFVAAYQALQQQATESAIPCRYIRHFMGYDLDTKQIITVSPSYEATLELKPLWNPTLSSVVRLNGTSSVLSALTVEEEVTLNLTGKGASLYQQAKDWQSQSLEWSSVA